MLQAQVNYWTLQESKRHNLVLEEQGQQSLNESKRHNVATETLGFSTLAETSRHNVAQEQIGWANVSEARRHNKRTEEISMYSAGTDRYNAYTRRDELTLKQDQFEWDKFAAVGLGIPELNARSEQAAASTKQAEAATRQAETAAKRQATEESQGWFNAISNAISSIARTAPLFIP